MCDHPLIALNLGVDKNGKKIVRFHRFMNYSIEDYYQRYGRENVLMIPCGKCSACELARRKEWAVRCGAEATDHEMSCFITLTYDNEHICSMSKNKERLKTFIKSIRNSGFKCRYFGCGERGSKTLRVHSHLILFGFCPTDLVYEKISESGEAIYSSRFLESLWKYGIVSVQLFGAKCGAYVAGYCSKKLGDGEGFQIQSTRPGLGYGFYKKNRDCILKYGRIYGDFGDSNHASIPRYFKKLLEKDGFGLFLDLDFDQNIKKARMAQYEQARLHGFSIVDQVFNYNKSFSDRRVMRLERGF